MFKKRTKPLLIVSHRLSVLVHLWCKISPSLWNYCYTCLIWVFLLFAVNRISWVATCCGSSRRAMDGRNCGWSSQTSASSSTKPIRLAATALQTPTGHRHQQSIDMYNVQTSAEHSHQQNIDMYSVQTQQSIDTNRALTSTGHRHQQSIDMYNVQTPTEHWHQQSIDINRA